MRLKNTNGLRLQEDLFARDLKRLSRAGIAGVDTEMTGINPNRDLLCLVQICDSQGFVNIIRTADWGHTPNLKTFFSSEEFLKIFHFALADCSFILMKLGIEVKNVYCTKIASKIARTYSPEHSLRALVKEFYGLELDKSQQTTDFLRPDLTSKQLEYAANDVLWLIDLKAKLDDLLERKGTLPTGISYKELNRRCQGFIPTLVHLAINGWNLGVEDRNIIFAH